MYAEGFWGGCGERDSCVHTVTNKPFSAALRALRASALRFLAAVSRYSLALLMLRTDECDRSVYDVLGRDAKLGEKPLRRG
mgnify:CR=1 FL=1